MRNTLRKIVEILDGTPAVYGEKNRWHGQSVVELTLVTPILIILLMGLAEIGWFANNYLILLEVTRVGARLGTSLTDMTPLTWNNDLSRSFKTNWNDHPAKPDGNTPYIEYFTCGSVLSGNVSGMQGFYNRIACTMQLQMDPLTLKANGIDDIVISAFSLYAVDRATLPTTAFLSYPGGTSTGQNPRNQITASLDASLLGNKQMIVVGRYPTNANECTVDVNNVAKVWERDPFDYYQDGERDYQLKDITKPDLPDSDPGRDSNRNYVELAGYDAPSYIPYTGAPAAVQERQRGWSLTGNHGISNVINTTSGTPVKQCLGSDWTSKDMEKLMNLPNFSLLSQERKNLPNQGVVLVEMFWQHDLLLKNPVFNPVFTILGPNTTISVWAAFPLSTTEPRINFNEDIP